MNIDFNDTEIYNKDMDVYVEPGAVKIFDTGKALIDELYFGFITINPQ